MYIYEGQNSMEAVVYKIDNLSSFIVRTLSLDKLTLSQKSPEVLQTHSRAR